MPALRSVRTLRVIVNNVVPLYPVLDERGRIWTLDLGEVPEEEVDHTVLFNAWECLPVTVLADITSFELKCVCLVANTDIPQEIFRGKPGAQNSDPDLLENLKTRVGNIPLHTPTEQGSIANGEISEYSYNDSSNELLIHVIFKDFKFLEHRRRGESPWCVAGELTWSISWPEPLDFTARVEVYGVYPGILPWMKAEGIPANLLRFALAPRDGTSGFMPTDYTPWQVDMTSRVFWSGFVYDRYGGSFSCAPGAGYHFQINKWLKLWTHLKGTASEETNALYHKRFANAPPKVNCMDQTAILGLCFTLGCKNDSDRRKIRPVFAKPFGFMKPTTLVGHQTACNSPYQSHYDNDGQTLLDTSYIQPRSSTRRTFFANHVFIVWDERSQDIYKKDQENDKARATFHKGKTVVQPGHDWEEDDIDPWKGGTNKVFDACAGPVCGDLTLEEYLGGRSGTGVIDHITPTMSVQTKKASGDPEKPDDCEVVSVVSPGHPARQLMLGQYTARLRDVGYAHDAESDGVGNRWGPMGELDDMMKHTLSNRPTELLPEEAEYALQINTVVDHCKNTPISFPNKPANPDVHVDFLPAPGLKGSKDYLLEVDVRGERHLIHVDWRTYNSSNQSARQYDWYAHGGLRGTLSPHSSTEKGKTVDGNPCEFLRIPSDDPKVENSCYALLGRCVVACTSHLDSENLLAFVRLLASTVSIKDESGLSIKRIDAKAVEAHVGEAFEVRYYVEGVAEIDWHYYDNNDSIFLADYWYATEDSADSKARKVLYLRFVTRRVTTGTWNKFGLSAFDWHFKEQDECVYYKVIA